MSRLTIIFSVILLSLYASFAQAADGRADYDLDDDGLIEINDLSDLDEIRNNLDGASLYADNTGCPLTGCTGFELTTHLDFDSNGDGVLSIDDSYWNGGAGWQPIGSNNQPFSAILNGNGFEIRNLMINRSTTSYVGLFAYTADSNLLNVVLTGDLLSVTGRGYVGALVGSASTTTIESSSVSGKVFSSDDNTGGLLGEATGSTVKLSASTADVTVVGSITYRLGGLIGSASNNTIIERCYSSGDVSMTTSIGYHVGGLAGQIVDSSVTSSYSLGSVSMIASIGYNAGGLAGEINNSSVTASYSLAFVSSNDDYVGGIAGNLTSSTITSSFATGSVEGGSYVGGLIGSDSGSTIASSYAIGLVTNLSRSGGGLIGDARTTVVTNSYWATDISQITTSAGGTGFLHNELTCPTSANNTTCAATEIYTGWDTSIDGDGNPYWDYGTASQLPGLIINGVVHRDTDGDGVLDSNDDFPLIFAASKDSDSDGSPDAFSRTCDSTCQADSGLSIDHLPNNAAAILDADLDGQPEQWLATCDASCQAASGLTLDTFPDDSDNDGILNSVDTDDNNDGIEDIDANSNGLLEITSLQQLDAIRNNLSGTSLIMNDNPARSMGCPIRILQGEYKHACYGYELMQNLDFDSNADGLLDAADEFWNDGLGWLPIGEQRNPFSARFDGNNFTIRNLMINRERNSYQGFFASMDKAAVNNITFDGPHTSLSGYSIIGLLAGYSLDSEVIDINVKGVINSVNTNGANAGGLIGNAIRTNIQASSADVVINTDGYNVGGLVGSMSSSDFVESFANVSYVGSSNTVGGLAGYFDRGSINASFATGHIISQGQSIGGLAGSVSGGTVNLISSFSSVYITAYGPAGGLWGSGSASIVLQGSYAIGKVSAYSLQGGLAGTHRFSSGNFTDNYWASDTTNQSLSGSDTTTGATGATLSELQCPVAADDTTCAGVPLYVGWSSYQDVANNPYWDFGTANQLPGLILNGVTYRDSDGDNVLDSLDDFPTNPVAAKDSDGDGAIDSWSLSCDANCQAASGFVLDAFPDNAAASVDNDADGLPDAWNSGCDASCISASGLVLDTSLNDLDNDGIANALDTDDNGDGNIDADADSDGLIEVSSLAELNAIRFNLLGTGRKLDEEGITDSSGCPLRIYNGVLQNVCIGYELTQDLNFDTNNDGILDINDEYWNDGQGWLPIGSPNSESFSGVLEGNGYVINNLMINRIDRDYQSFITRMDNATIRNLGLSGELMSIQGKRFTAGLAATVSNSSIEACFVTGSVKSLEVRAGGLAHYLINSTVKASLFSGTVSATEYIGGLAAVVSRSTVEASFAVGTVTADRLVGGLIGSASSSSILNSYSAAVVTGNTETGGMIASSFDNTVTNSYWAVDTSGQATSQAGAGFTSTELQCPTAADNSTCASATLYAGWDNDLNPSGGAYWNFGSASLLPSLILNGKTIGDTDGDGVFDVDDAFPSIYAASVDNDNDGAPDQWTVLCDALCQQNSALTLDSFPENAAASVDSDLDGLPESWNSSCDSACQTASGLTLDSFADDFDNDGIIDSIDDDDNGDGIVDIDADSDGLIDINSLEELDAMRYSLTGAYQKLSAEAVADNSGCPAALANGKLQRVCKGYELLQNLDFDTNGDGVLNNSDTYWNNRSGWVAIGSSSQPFQAVFDGNGFIISNLMIQRRYSDYQALWAYTSYSTIKNLELSGPLMYVEGDDSVAGIVGSASFSSILNTSVNGQIRGSRQVGGLVGDALQLDMTNSRFTGNTITADSDVGGLMGRAVNSNIINSYADVDITSQSSSGGLLGEGTNVVITGSYALGRITARYDNHGGLIGDGGGNAISNSFSSVEVTGRSNIAGLNGGSASTNSISNSFATGFITATSGRDESPLSRTGVIENSFWATDTTGQSENAAGGVGLTLAEMQCPVSDNNTTCAAVTLYADWLSYVDTDGNPYWDFGETNQLPGLSIAGVVHRDSDGDSALDANDAFPLDNTESVDTDNDGIGNNADTDDDNDGVEDALDLFPLDPLESTDFDGDGIGDTADTDDDNDGVLDINDPDNNVDNGKPVIESAATISLRATGETTLLNLSGEESYRSIEYYDSYSDWNESGEIVLEVSLNGELLIPNENNQISLPSGAVRLQWVAIDAAGNRSDPFEQLVNVYPLVGFETASSITGEPSQARLKITFSGPSPEFPVVINFSFSEQSATYDDLETNFINQENISITLENEDELNNAVLVVPVIDENMAEVDEVINVKINNARAGDDEFYMPVYNSENGGNFEHDLTITETNLPPAVSLEIYQDGNIVDVIDSAGGEVEIVAVVVDPNGNDSASVVWDLTEISASAANDATRFTFNPSALANGFYGITINVTDNADIPLSVEETFVLVVEKNEATKGASGGGGGGSLNPLFLLLFLSLFVVRLKRK